MTTRSVNVAPIVYGDGPALDDPAELFHEASKLSRRTAARQVRMHVLANPEVRASLPRAGKRLGSAVVSLPAPAYPRATLEELLAARGSERSFGDEPLGLAELSSLLFAAYGVTGRTDPGGDPEEPLRLRTVPSGGALFPLELYIAAGRIEGLPPGAYHFDPSRHVLERAGGTPMAARLRDAILERSLTDATVLVLVTAMFWRTRFKYGLRGYRFALLEGGHACQNLLLAATALGLAALPLGGFFDREIEDALGLDGVNEAAVYAAAVGRRPQP